MFEHKRFIFHPFESFLCSSTFSFKVRDVSPTEQSGYISVNQNGTVTIRGIENQTCLTLIDNIHRKKYLTRTLYCNGIIAMTPEK